MSLLACFAAGLLHLNVTAPPALALGVDHLPTRGHYQHSTVLLRSDADCAVVIHELVHHQQFARYGSATTQYEWSLREREATAAEQRWRND